MKVCIVCGQPKDEEQFHKTKHRTYNFCKQCLYLRQMIRWNNQKIKAIIYLGSKCIDCERSFPELHPVAFDFDHRNPNEKEVDWTKLRIRSWDKIVVELDKCDLRCCICHRIRHTNHTLWPSIAR